MKLTVLTHRLKLAFQDTYEQLKQAQLFLVASSLAYTTILSLVPLLAVSFAIFRAFGGLEKLYETVAPFIISNLAQGTSEEVIKKIHGFIESAHTHAIGIGGFVGLLLTSMSMLSSVEKAINRVWHVPVRRSWFQRISAYWLFITLGPLATAVALGIATSSDLPLTRFLPGGTGIFVMFALFFFIVYKWVPCCAVHWKYAVVSSLFTSVGLNIARLTWGLYANKVLSYSNIYGSLGAIPLLLLWIYIVWLIILCGAALNAALQKRLEPGGSRAHQR